MNILTAKKYAQALRDAQNIPVEVDEKIEMSLPKFADHARIKRSEFF